MLHTHTTHAGEDSPHNKMDAPVKYMDKNGLTILTICTSYDVDLPRDVPFWGDVDNAAQNHFGV